MDGLKLLKRPPRQPQEKAVYITSSLLWITFATRQLGLNPQVLEPPGEHLCQYDH